MRYVYILEEEKKFQKEIADAILSIDPQIQLRFFDKISDFFRWLKLVKKLGSELLSQGGYVPEFLSVESPPATKECQLSLIAAKADFLKSHHVNFFGKLRKLFLAQKLCSEDLPTNFVLTAFEGTNIKIKLIKESVVTNVIYKPFDDLILKQDLAYAIDGRHKVSTYAITNQKIECDIEMLKEVQLEGLSEVGFISINDRKLEVGKSSKYYGNIFSSEQRRSIMAKMVFQEPHPIIKGHFRCFFSFLGADRNQILNFRKKIKDKSMIQIPFDWRQRGTPSEKNFILVDQDREVADLFKNDLQKKWGDVKFFIYGSYSEFIFDLDPQTQLKEQKTGENFFSETGNIHVLFDYTGTKILKAQTTDKKVVKMLGTDEGEYRTKDWFNLKLSKEFQEVWKKWVQKPVTPFYVPIFQNEKLFLIKVISAKKNDDQSLLIQFCEALKDEKMAWFQQNSKLPKRIDGIFVGQNFLGEGGQQRWSEALEKCKARNKPAPTSQEPLRLFALSNKLFSIAEEKILTQYVDDIFYKALDRAYFVHKLAFFYPSMKVLGESLTYATIKVEEKIRSATAIKLHEISEAGIVMEYYRSIALGKSREFLLWKANEHNAQEIMANCNYVEENKDAKVFICHFVFFGITEHYLKEIRLWIRDNYIESKNKAA